MKKLFISCPMRGRKEEDIKKSFERMHRIAEAIFDEKLEVIDSFIEEDPPASKSVAVWHLGKSIEKMANADYFIGPKGYWKYPGCMVEREVADQYDIPRFYVDFEYVAPDIEEDEPMENKKIEHGHWINHTSEVFPADSTVECSVCHEHESILLAHDNYCPNCGAKMDGKENE